MTGSSICGSIAQQKRRKEERGRIVLANYVALIEGDGEENRKEYINQEKPVEIIILKKRPLPPKSKGMGIRGANL